jgi:Domain of unknown function (DUF4406)
MPRVRSGLRERRSQGCKADKGIARCLSEWQVKVAYIAGPFRSKTHWGIVQNVRAAEQVALKYWKLGFAVICPHLNTANFDGAIADDHIWLDGDMEILKRCDVVIAMNTWKQSSGATTEIELAKQLGIEVIFDEL